MKKLFIPIQFFFILQANAYEINPDIKRNIDNFGVPVILSSIAQNEAKRAPYPLNSEVDLISVQSKNHKNINLISYQMRMKKIEKEKTDEKLLKSSIPNSLKMDANELCSSPLSEALIKEYAVIYKYFYYDKNMNLLYSYDIDKKVCEQK